MKPQMLEAYTDYPIEQLGAAALAEAILDHHWVKEVKFSIEDCYED